jgi:hypothetical protein
MFPRRFALQSDLRFSQKDHAGQSAATTID